jgi:hypothetical protein
MNTKPTPPLSLLGSPSCSASSKDHFGDKTLHCKLCDQDIFIPHNQVGGFWHLGGWSNPHGIKFWGGYCSPCFRKLDDIISLPNASAMASADEKTTPKEPTL